MQSWKTMYVRRRKPAAGTASTRASQTETSSAKRIATSSARYGTTDVATSSRLRETRGCAYGARICRHV